MNLRRFLLIIGVGAIALLLVAIPSSTGLTASFPGADQPNRGEPGATGGPTGSVAGSAPALPAGSGGTATTTESGVAFGGDTFLSESPPPPVDADEEKSENN